MKPNGLDLDLEEVAEIYDEAYFLDGRRSGKSLYEDYRWIPELTIPFVKRVIEYVGMEPGETVLDFGCARGYVVKAFRELGYNAVGVDCSSWAIENCDEDVRDLVVQSYRPEVEVDWIVAKDVLEHLDSTELGEVLRTMAASASKGFLVIVPLADGTLKRRRYVIPEYELDVTHVQRFTLIEWYWLIQNWAPDFQVNCSFRVPGMKDNYAHVPDGNGFLLAKRCR